MNTSSYITRMNRSEVHLPIRGVDYCVYEWGEIGAPTLIYLHGWADMGATFQFVVDALEKDWFVVAPDWRGFGRTQTTVDSYWFPDYLADLHALLEHYSPDTPATLIGHSMGANIAALYAGSIPERVARLINIEGFGLPDSDPGEAPLRYRSWIESLSADIAFSSYADFGALARRIKKQSPGMADATADFVAREWGVADSSGRVELRADIRHKQPNPVLYRRAEAEACWRAIRADMLLVSGDAGPFSLGLDTIDTLPLPKHETEVIEGCGHRVQFEAPRQLAAAIENFLR